MSKPARRILAPLAVLVAALAFNFSTQAPEPALAPLPLRPTIGCPSQDVAAKQRCWVIDPNGGGDAIGWATEGDCWVEVTTINPDCRVWACTGDGTHCRVIVYIDLVETITFSTSCGTHLQVEECTSIFPKPDGTQWICVNKP